MKVYKDFELTDYNSFKIKAKCAVAYFPDTVADIIQIYKRSLENRIVILGNGNNIILSKPYYDSEFIILKNCFNKINIRENIIEAEAGATLEQLSQVAANHSLSGLEIFYDIPSSVGGAVVMNAGANGYEIKDVLIKVAYLDLNNFKVNEISKNELNYSYRNSIFQKDPHKTVIKGWFGLHKGNKDTILSEMNHTKLLRWEKQPRDYPNCGSVFKRPKGHYVGAMVEQLGLKGLTIGGAKVSEKHAGFIINKGNATGEEIIRLIEEIRLRVKKEFKVDLELEQRIIM